MIIFDFSPCLHAAFHVISKELNEPSLDLVRHVTLNTIRATTAKWKGRYGETVLAMDNGSWRKNVFPQYKGDRKKKREESEIDWKLLFSHMKIVEKELEEYYPGRVIRLPETEADDIIATLCKHYHKQEEIMVISPDNDMRQLLKYPGVSVYSSLTKTLHTMKQDRAAQVASSIALLNQTKSKSLLDDVSDLISDVSEGLSSFFD